MTEAGSSVVIGTNRRATKKTENNKITVENLSKHILTTDSPSVILALSKGLTKIALNSHVTILLSRLLMPTGSRVFTLESLFYHFYLSLLLSSFSFHDHFEI